MVVEDGRAAVFIAAAAAGAASVAWRRPVVGERNAVYVIAHVRNILVVFLVAIVLILETVGLRHVDVHVAHVSNGRRTISVDAVPLRRLVICELAHLVFEFIDEAHDLKSQYSNVSWELNYLPGAV